MVHTKHQLLKDPISVYSKGKGKGGGIKMACQLEKLKLMRSAGIKNERHGDLKDIVLFEEDLGIVICVTSLLQSNTPFHIGNFSNTTKSHISHYKQ